MLRLQVPNVFAHRQAALNKGAFQYKEDGYFYARSKDTYGDFLPWIINQGQIVVCGQLYLAQTNGVCPRCRATTRMLLPMVQSYFDFTSVVSRDSVYGRTLDEFYEGGYDQLRFLSPIYPIPARIYEWMQQKFSVTVARLDDFPGGESILARCDRCEGILPIRYMLGDERSGFAQIDEDKAAQITLYEFRLENDFVAKGRISGDPLMRKYLTPEQIIPIDVEADILSYPQS